MKRPRRTILALLASAALVAGLAALLVDGERDGERDGRRAGRATAGPTPPDPVALAPGGDSAQGADDGQAAGRSAGDLGAVPRVDETPPATPARVLTDDEVRAAIARGEPGFEVLASRLAEAPLALAPRWAEGDQWLVETWYRQAQAPDAPWSGPALWRFQVAREVSFQDVPCHELVVTRVDEAGVAPMTLWVSRAGRLVGAETTVVQQGKQQRALFVAGDGASPEPAALRAPPGSAPVRLPPLGALASAAPPGLAFDRTTAASDLPADLPAAGELVGAGRTTYDIEFTDPTDGTIVKQRWSPDDLRWPVVSRTETTLSIRRG